MGQESACDAGDTGSTGSIPGSGRFSRGGNGSPLQCSRLKSPVDRGAWRVRAVAKSRIRLKRLSTDTYSAETAYLRYYNFMSGWGYEKYRFLRRMIMEKTMKNVVLHHFRITYRVPLINGLQCVAKSLSCIQMLPAGL